MLHIRLIIVSAWLMASFGACSTTDTLSKAQESHQARTLSPIFTLDDYTYPYPIEEVHESPVVTPKPATPEPSVTRVAFEPSSSLKDSLPEHPTVHFAFNRWEIAPKWRKVLSKTADYLDNKQQYWLEVEGHCDQRGTEAYNLILGEKRANAVRDYLVNLGVEPERIRVFSYGKAAPYCQDDEDTCYDMNRRAEIIVHASKP